MAQAQKEIAARKNDPKPLNSLGVIYAQFGRIDLADSPVRCREQDGRLSAGAHQPRQHPFPPAGLQGRLRPVPEGGTRDQTNGVAILGIARSDAGLEKFDDARTEYATLQTVDPDLAKQFSYLGDQGTDPVAVRKRGRALRSSGLGRGDQS